MAKPSAYCVHILFNPQLDTSTPDVPPSPPSSWEVGMSVPLPIMQAEMSQPLSGWPLDLYWPFILVFCRFGLGLPPLTGKVAVLHTSFIFFYYLLPPKRVCTGFCLVNCAAWNLSNFLETKNFDFTTGFGKFFQVSRNLYVPRSWVHKKV